MVISQKINTKKSVLLLCISMLAQQARADIVNITNEEGLSSIGQPCIVKFFASWCGACNSIKEQYEQLAKEQDGQGVIFAAADVDQAGELARKYKISGIPTLIYFDAQSTIVHEVHGVRNPATFQADQVALIKEKFPNAHGFFAKMKRQVKNGYEFVATKAKSIFGIA